MYESGQSLKAISRQIDVPKSSLRGILLQGGMVLRAHSNNQNKIFKKPRMMSVKTAPYGFCLINGQLKEDPRESVVVQLIFEWWQQGMSQMAITRKLNEQKLKPRSAKEWSQPSVRKIIKRNLPIV